VTFVNADDDPVNAADDLLNTVGGPVFDIENGTKRRIHIALKRDNTATYEQLARTVFAIIGASNHSNENLNVFKHTFS